MTKSALIALILPARKAMGYNDTFVQLMRKPLWRLWFMLDLLTRADGGGDDYFAIKQYWLEQFAVELFPIKKES